MDSKIVARPLVTITNVIWSFNTELHRPQLLLIKRADEPLKGKWALPETLLRSHESADAACIRLIDDKIGLQVPMSSTEQLATFTDPNRVADSRALSLAYMTYLPSTPKLHPGYGATDAQWFTLSADQHKYVISHDRQQFILTTPSDLAFDHVQIINTAINRIKNKLDYQPGILHILGDSFTLRQAREVFAAFLGTTLDKIDNSNFKKTHNHLFKEVGTVSLQHSGRPPKLFKLNC